MFCPKCGHKNSAENKFCNNCGILLPKIPPTFNSPHKSTGTSAVHHRSSIKPRSGSNGNIKYVFSGIAAGVIIAAGIIGYSYLVNSKNSNATLLIRTSDNINFNSNDSYIESSVTNDIIEDKYSYGTITQKTAEDATSPSMASYKRQVSTAAQSRESLPDSENINGFTINWHDASSSQRNVIKKLLADMVFVEGGYFYMGTDNPDAYADEKPSHGVNVGNFYINKYEVTQNLWEAVMDKNPSINKGDNLPVENISWQDCQQFIRNLNSLTGLSFRLPTEAEWEFAARGGNRSRNYTYSGGDTAENVGWISTNSGNKTHRVGSKRSNELGLYDMTGNVWEWTSQKWSPDYNSPRSNENYVRRGGSAIRPSKFQRITYRNRGDKVDNGKLYGMRLVI